MKNLNFYHEIDFLLPAQRFEIDFSYITQKGLPFVREYVLRLVNLAPMTNSQIANFFGFSAVELEEAIGDLIERDELTLTNNGRLSLTEKSRSYFSDVGDAPQLSSLMDSGVGLAFDLATFTCQGNDIPKDRWKSGIQLGVKEENSANSEAHAEIAFQQQFNQIFRKRFLAKSLAQEDDEPPTIYTVNSVNKIRQMPLRLNVKFAMDDEGRSVEWDDFEQLSNSECVHESISTELNRLERPNNLTSIVQAMLEIGDAETIKVLDLKSNSLNLGYFEELVKLEDNRKGGRNFFLGPVYSRDNWQLVQKKLAPIIQERTKQKEALNSLTLTWIAPSDPFWSKSNHFSTAMSELLTKAQTKDKKIYSPTIYVPVAGADDARSAKRWKHELEPNIENVHALVEGFLGGNVEVLFCEGEFAVVVYHLILSGNYPVTLPIGFVTEDAKMLSSIERIVDAYITGSRGFERPNQLGKLSRFTQSR